MHLASLYRHWGSARTLLARLEEAGEGPALRTRHLTWYRELDNVRAALARSQSGRRDSEAALALASGLTFLRIAKGYVDEGQAQLTTLLPAIESACAPVV